MNRSIGKLTGEEFMGDFAVARQRMVDNQLRTNDVTDLRIIGAMAAVPRELFVPKARRAVSYIDDDVAIRDAAEGMPARYLMKPHVFARLVQLAEIRPEDVVLVVGCATGYSAAVLARIAGSVVGLEADEELAATAGEILVDQGIDNAAVVAGALSAGLPDEGPYDVILIDGAIEALPEGLSGQLKQGGRLVCIKGQGNAAEALLATRSDDTIGIRSAFNAAVHPVPGFERPREFVF